MKIHTENDVEFLINEAIDESLHLEYKRCDALKKKDREKNEISKDVSSFANSAGGTIVYGVIEDGHKPIKIDAGFDPKEITKEWLEAIIESKISSIKNPKIIVFSQYRDSVTKICKEINSIENASAKVFVGQAKKGEGKNETGLSQREQQEIIKDFSSGKINILWATQIGE